MLWDEQGEWLDDDGGADAKAGLQRLLARPLSHMWQETPDGRFRTGHGRWAPAISEYRQVRACHSTPSA